MKSFTSKLLGLTAVYALIACGGDGKDPISQVANLCGFNCGAGIADGNTSISGIQQVDSFFEAVVNFETAAVGVSGGIQAELAAIKADFGIDANTALATGLKTKLEANLDAKLAVSYEPARCAVDAQATLEATAKCDVDVKSGTAMVECKGSCEASVNAEVDCSANAELYCTATAPSIECKGECQGSCDFETTGPSFECNGTCTGMCDGTCSAFADASGSNAKCAGQCTGKCMGSCKAEFAAKASCSGKCTGECTAKPATAKCEGSVRAECRAKADAKFECKGRCTGEFEPPSVKAECEASAKAQASLHVECSPPRLAVQSSFKASADAQFKAALRVLVDVRLPALLQAVGKGKVVAKAGEDLGLAAKGAVDGAVKALEAKAKLKAAFGLGCALKQLDSAGNIVGDASAELNKALIDARNLSVALGLEK